jgi:hypothetical protein
VRIVTNGGVDPAVVTTEMTQSTTENLQLKTLALTDTVATVRMDKHRLPHLVPTRSTRRTDLHRSTHPRPRRPRRPRTEITTSHNQRRHQAHPNGLPLHRYKDLLHHLSTLDRHIINFNGQRIEKITTPTPLQRRAFELLGAPVPVTLQSGPRQSRENSCELRLSPDSETKGRGEPVLLARSVVAVRPADGGSNTSAESRATYVSAH